MLVLREKLLVLLKVASAGAALPPRMVSLEQSDHFIFKDGQLLAFNDEIMVRAPSPLDFDVIVPAADLIKVLGKMPEKEIDISPRKGRLIIKGKRREYGLPTQKKVILPFGDVAQPGEWSTLKEGTTGMLKQAARTCGKDLANALTTVVHAAPDMIQACDNLKIFRATFKTGFPKAVLIPAYSLAALESIPLTKVSLTRGWAHFRAPGKTSVSVKLMKDDYSQVTQAIDGMLKVKNTEVIYLPENLAQMIERAEVMKDTEEPLIQVTIEKGKLLLRSKSKTGGYFRETKKIVYKGRRLNFNTNPKFLVELLSRTTKARINDEKMKVRTKEIEFVITMEAVED